jgi:hypothetical protein
MSRKFQSLSAVFIGCWLYFPHQGYLLKEVKDERETQNQ